MIYKSNLKAKNPLKMEIQDLRLASYLLDVPAGELKALLLYCEEITDRRAQSLIKVKQLLSFDKNYQYFEDNSFSVDTPRRDWILMCYMYIIENTTPTLITQELSRFLSFVTRWIQSRAKIYETERVIQEKKRDIYTEYAHNSNVFNFFNAEKFIVIGTEYGIHSWVDNNKLVMQWNDVEISSPKNEVLYYPKIILILCIPDFYVERYVIYSHKFSYDSDWKLNPLIHPNLNDADILCYGRNNFIEFLPLREYRMIIEIFDELIHDKSTASFASFDTCKETYGKLSVLWESIDVSKPIEERSQLLFEKLKGSI